METGYNANEVKDILKQKLSYAHMKNMSLAEYESFVIDLFTWLDRVRQQGLKQEHLDTDFLNSISGVQSHYFDNDTLFEARFGDLIEEIAAFCPSPFFWDVDLDTYLNKWRFRFKIGVYAPPVIKADELLALPKDNLILIDAGSGTAAFERYKQQHLAGALYVDLDTDLAEIPADAKNGGRHPLPSPEQFGKLLGRLGIYHNCRVVVYDDKNGTNAASRFWWMLKGIWHPTVQVLNGGLQAAVAAGFPVASGIETATPVGDYPFREWANPTATMAEAEVAAQNPQQVVIDVRDANRYNGLTEPIDPVAGHIPGAVNIPLTGNLDENGLFLSREALREKYLHALNGVDAGQAVVHCGSGVTACHTILAMDYAGLPMPKLYVGSYSEWCRNKGVATI